jgi:choline dehydrogenase-like flavoprotein
VDVFFDKTDLEMQSIYYIQNELIKIFKHSNYLFSPKNKKNINIHHANHHSGTMKMSKSDKLGVVDKNLKVHDINNLYICDSSIFPYFGNSNPVLTILSLANRLSNFFKNLNY